MYLPDTNVVSEIRKIRTGKADRQVATIKGYSTLAKGGITTLG